MGRKIITKEIFTNFMDTHMKNEDFNNNVPIGKIEPKFIFHKLPFFGGFNLLLGESAIGKSNFAINLALYRASQGNRVLYWTSDSPKILIQSRMQEIMNNKYEDKIDIILKNLFVMQAGSFEEEMSMDDLLIGADLTLDLFIIDSSSSVSFNNTHSEYEEQRKYCLLMEKFNPSNCTYLSIHELNKNKEIKGNLSQVYKSNNIYTITKSKNYIDIECTKDRYSYGTSEKFKDLFNLEVYEKKEILKTKTNKKTINDIELVRGWK